MIDLLQYATKNISSSKHLAVWKWFSGCPNFPELYFIFSSADNGDVIMQPDTLISPTSSTAENVIQSYIDGSQEKEYVFTVAVILPKETSGNGELKKDEQGNEYFSNENIDFVGVVESIAEWTKQQNDEENFPIFGEMYKVENIETLSSGDGIVAQDETGVKYSFAIRINYTDYTNRS